jgi:divalent metal cation (Fe/Co/Zn/Cd) transporter
MRSVALLLSPLAAVALVLAFGWPVLLACFALALSTLLFSTADTEAGESSTTLQVLKEST